MRPRMIADLMTGIDDPPCVRRIFGNLRTRKNVAFTFFAASVSSNSRTVRSSTVIRTIAARFMRTVARRAS